MSAPIITTQNWQPEAYDLVIDVRAPIEFAEDHIVGAVNMPVLSDIEREEIGTLYKQVLIDQIGEPYLSNYFQKIAVWAGGYLASAQAKTRGDVPTPQGLKSGRPFCLFRLKYLS